jgi:hypothetical protein
LDENVKVCPYCGNVLHKKQDHKNSNGKNVVATSAMREFNERVERNRERLMQLPRDEHLLAIINDFEMKNEVIYKPAPAPRVYRAENAYTSQPVQEKQALNPLKFVFNLLLALILPLVGLICGIVYLTRKVKAVKVLGAAMILLNLISGAAWAYVVMYLLL